MTAPPKPVRFTPQAPQAPVTGCERGSDLACSVGEMVVDDDHLPWESFQPVFMRRNSMGTAAQVKSLGRERYGKGVLANTRTWVS
jgi:hypothetical protein